jgi:hypothetical protein
MYRNYNPYEKVHSPILKQIKIYLGTTYRGLSWVPIPHALSKTFKELRGKWDYMIPSQRDGHRWKEWGLLLISNDWYLNYINLSLHFSFKFRERYFTHLNFSTPHYHLYHQTQLFCMASSAFSDLALFSNPNLGQAM